VLIRCPALLDANEMAAAACLQVPVHVAHQLRCDRCVFVCCLWSSRDGIRCQAHQAPPPADCSCLCTVWLLLPTWADQQQCMQVAMPQLEPPLAC